MLSVFPSLLDYSFFAPTVLRVAAGCVLFLVAYTLWKQRALIAQERFPVIVTCPPWLTGMSSFVIAVIGFLLVAGMWTQIAALAGALVALKGIFFGQRYRTVVPLPLSTNVLLLVILLSLVVTGAGALAFDLPL